MLFVQGARDAFGTPAEIAPVVETIGPSASIHIVSGGDHSLKLARKDPAAQAAVYDDVQRTIVEWMRTITKK
jgi:predicted alpha/beta-hydrolase family hydrolase